MKRHSHVCVLVMAAVLFENPAWAGPGYVEPPSDAGSLPASAAPVTGGSGEVKMIRGNLGVSAESPGDLEDMYLINITNTVTFCARTMLTSENFDCCNSGNHLVAAANTNFNTQLFLFRANGHGLLANDDLAGGNQLSRIGNTSTDGSGAMLVTPGLYYLAISAGPSRDPVSIGGLIFNQVSVTEVSGPDGPGGTNPIIQWTGAGVTNVHYEISLCGVEYLQGIPTVTEWGAMTLTALMGLAGMAMIARRHQHKATVQARAVVQA